jgi:membrane protease YdiL (CAAX protease family)
MRNNVKDIIRSIALTVTFPAIGFAICLFLKMIFKVEISRLICSILNLVVAALAVFYLFPRVFGIPFGKIRSREFNKRIGFYLPEQAWKHIVLGVILAICTLSGILIASLLTGRFKFDFGKITLTHAVFSLNPGIWEEVFYRGVLMMVLLPLTKSLKRAAAIQIVIFGLSHIKGFNLTALFEVISVIVIAIGFTYTAHKTRSLIAGIVFHYLHDTCLFFVQPPGGLNASVIEEVLLYALLWSMVGVGCLVTRFAVEKFRICASSDLYTIEQDQSKGAAAVDVA